MITKTYDPEQWQLVPVRPSDAMIAGMETLDWTDSDVRANCFNMWQTALAAAPQHESQWQDISTAPRGGRILVWSPDIGQCVASAGWDTETPDDIRWGVANDIYVEPTLWMPLPQHPNTIKVPRPEGHDSWSIEIKTSGGGRGGGGGGKHPDTGETTSSESNSPT